MILFTIEMPCPLRNAWGISHEQTCLFSGSSQRKMRSIKSRIF